MATAKPYAIVAKSAMEITKPDGTTEQVAAGYVLNVVMWDGGPEWSPPEGTEAVDNSAGTLIIGGTVSSSST